MHEALCNARPEPVAVTIVMPAPEREQCCRPTQDEDLSGVEGCQALNSGQPSKSGYNLGIRLESQPSSQLGLLARTFKPSLESPKRDAQALGLQSMRRCGSLKHGMQ